jgi:hypothetical protein
MLMKKDNHFLAKVAEKSKIGFAAIIAGAFCVVFSLVYTMICYVNRRE